MRRNVVIGSTVLVIAAAVTIYAVREQSAPREVAMLPTAPVGAVLLDGLGEHHFPITTSSPEAQRWFNQGLMLTYGFNHGAAERSFLKAVEKDAECAMCWWGAALVLGPHINAPMDPANNGKAWMRLQQAQALADDTTPREQAYIRALGTRFAETPPADRRPLDVAYAEAMAQVVAEFPDDLDAATLQAEALMNLQPWEFYDAQQEPKGNTPRIVATLESVMQRDPEHAGALHLYIHAVEASREPQRGVDAADRLRELIPGSGHLVHMPAHIYTRVGRYHDAVLANQKAIEADDAYLAACRPAPGVYPLGYVPHNHHYLWWAASMEGDSATALAAAEETARRANIPEMLTMPGFGFLQDFLMTPLKAKVQFGRWEEVMATPKPAENMPYTVAIWHFAQGMAAAHQQRIADVERHLANLATIAVDPAMAELLVGPERPLSNTLKIAERVLAGQLALARGQHQAAIDALEQAVALEDRLPYFEPPLWHQPVRHLLGAALLAADKPAAAEAVYRADLQRNAGNGWALYGLMASLRQQNKRTEAAATEQQFRMAWQHSDIDPQPLMLSLAQ